MALLLIVAFIIGALTVVVLEATGLWILIRRLDRKLETEENKAKSTASVSSPVDLDSSLREKQVISLILPCKLFISLSCFELLENPSIFSMCRILNFLFTSVSVLKSSYYY